MNVFEYIENLEKITLNELEQKEKQLVRSNSKKIIEINQSKLLKGEGVNGEKTPVYRSKKYAARKKRINRQNTGRFDYRFSGLTFKKMFLQTKSKSFKIDTKLTRKGLFKRLSKNKVFGISKKEYIEFGNEHISPEMTDLIKRNLRR